MTYSTVVFQDHILFDGSHVSNSNNLMIFIGFCSWSMELAYHSLLPTLKKTEIRA